MRRVPAVLLAVMVHSSSAAAQQPCTSNANEITAAIYRQVLERPPDPGGRTFMYDIASGRGTVRENVAAVALSREHLERFLWPGVVDAAFRATRGARPEEREMMPAVRALGAGQADVPAVVAGFAAQEALTHDPSVRVPLLYRRLLGREPDGTAARFERMADRFGVERVARSIVVSPEYAQRFGRNGIPGVGPAAYVPAIRTLYRHLLGRDADRQGLEFFAREAADSGLRTVITQLLSSEEYMRRFGDHRVPGPGPGGPAYCGPSRR